MGSIWTGGVISTDPEPYEPALSAEKHINTHVHICVFHILLGMQNLNVVPRKPQTTNKVPQRLK